MTNFKSWLIVCSQELPVGNFFLLCCDCGDLLDHLGNLWEMYPKTPSSKYWSPPQILIGALSMESAWKQAGARRQFVIFVFVSFNASCVFVFEFDWKKLPIDRSLFTVFMFAFVFFMCICIWVCLKAGAHGWTGWQSVIVKTYSHWWLKCAQEGRKRPLERANEPNIDTNSQFVSTWDSDFSCCGFLNHSA